HLNYLAMTGENWETVPEMLDLAELYVYHLNQLDKGIELLNKTITIPGLSPKQLATCKLQLGDAMLIKGEIWEADLLYKQVEKAFTNDALGQEARYRYSRLCYYRGEFLWAQVQLDVLKGATTQLVSNNAMRLWLIIQDNIGLDTNDEALKQYAKADLLIFRNEFDAAIRILDSIPAQFPGHTLSDEILFAKALICEKRGEFKNAEQYYLTITKDYSYDILADNALFNLAKLYEYNLNDTAKAKRMYELLILNYTGSLFVSEARKHYRLLRGDAIKEQEISN
ncbi:MAG: tetratricopeptide repeat protein, partial [Bacteroidetes bacterium]|nr:tetratricopeptide repeat protein [Bacteroidota bacterium]